MATDVQGKELREELELTPRELAVAQGEDPDEVEELIEGEAEGEVPVDATDGDDTGTEAGDGDGVGDEAGDEQESEAEVADEGWATSEVKALAATYGLDDDDLAKFDGEADFLRVASVLERKLSATKPSAKVDTVSSQEPDGKVEVKEADSEAGSEAASEGGDKAKDDELPLIDPEEYRKAGYEDEVVNLARVAKVLQERLSKLAPAFEQQQQQQQQEEHNRVMREFDQTLDTMDRYGKSENLTKEDYSRRETLWNTARVVAQDMATRGQQIPDMAVLLRRAEIAAFGDELLAEKKADFNKKVKSQGAKRRPVGRTVARTGKRPAADGADDPVAAIANSPEMKQFWEENSTD